jgi:hypothetical protein
MDELSYRTLSQLDLPEVRLMALEDFEKGDEELLSAKRNRSPIEYYFTCTPSLLLSVLKDSPEVDLITYLDADVFFFADPAPVYDEIGASSIAIIGHRFPACIRDLERTGIYNVGWLSFRRDERALACLRWWRERCIEWCYDRCEDGRYADQKYLDEWPSRFQGVVVLRHKGANLAPWNLANYRIRGGSNRVWVDEEPLIFFHFHGLKQICGWVIDPTLAFYHARASAAVSHNIYRPYIRTLSDVRQEVMHLSHEVLVPTRIRGERAKSESPEHIPTPRRLARRSRALLHLFGGILTRKYLLVINGRVM